MPRTFKSESLIAAAVMACRAERPARIILALPVAPPETLRRLSDESPDKVTSKAIERVLAGQVRFAYDDTHGG